MVFFESTLVLTPFWKFNNFACTRRYMRCKWRRRRVGYIRQWQLKG